MSWWCAHLLVRGVATLRVEVVEQFLLWAEGTHGE